MASLPNLHRIHDYLLFHAAQRGSHPAIRWEGEVIDYATLAAEVRNIAAALIAAGVERGDRVAMLSPPRPEYWVAFLAASMIGAVWLGVDPRYRLPEIMHVLRDAEPRLLLAVATVEDLRPVLAEVAAAGVVGRIVTIGDGEGPHSYAAFRASGVPAQADLDRRDDETTADDAVFLVYTSGTTGRSKGALLSHRGLIGRALMQHHMWPCDDIRIINVLPINHIGSVGFISLYALVGGGTQILAAKFRPDDFLARLEAEAVTVWIGLPTMFLMVMERENFDPARLHRLQWAIWSGAAMPQALIQRLRAIGCRLGSSYGLTETSGSVCYAPVGADDRLLARTIGRPAPPGELRVADQAGNRVPVGREGEIQARPERAMKGYFRLDAASREARTGDGWVRTGDVGRVEADGCITLVGRLKEMFKSGGYNVYPREIEDVIESHPLVAMCAVVALPDPLFQEVGAAFVQPAPAARLTAAEIVGWCRDRLANYKVPKHVAMVEVLPMLGVGKVDKRALRQQADRLLADRPAPPESGGTTS